MTTKFNIKKFFGKNDFGLWRIKIDVILIQQDFSQAIMGDKHVSVYVSKGEG